MALPVSLGMRAGHAIKGGVEKAAETRAPIDGTGEIVGVQLVRVFEGTCAATGAEETLEGPEIAVREWEREEHWFAPGLLTHKDKGIVKVLKKVLAGQNVDLPLRKGTRVRFLDAKVPTKNTTVNARAATVDVATKEKDFDGILG